MRLDKYLQLAGIIPRRTRAQEACSRGYVELNGRAAKPAAAVAVGDRISVRLGGRESQYEVLTLPNRPVPKASRQDAARLVETTVVNED
jgi:ribosomal 50S subunit-recycling heat shock protein